MEETFKQKWAIISLLEDASEGAEFYYTDFPLHVTLAGVFETEKNGSRLYQELSELLRNQKPIEIEAEDRAMFGPLGDVAVMKIKQSRELMDLYWRVYKWLDESGVTYNSPEYQGEGYLPHSTLQKSGSLEQNEKRILDSVSIIDLYPNNDGYRRKIFRTVQLS